MSDPIERKIAECLVDKILGAGYRISVYDGEQKVLSQATDRQMILDAMFSTEEDVLWLSQGYSYQPNDRVGMIWLIYGNGRDVISDHSDKPIINGLVEATMKEFGDA